MNHETNPSPADHPNGTPEEDHEPGQREKRAATGATKAMGSSKLMSWQTPPAELDLVRRVAPIGLDPATVDSNPTKAKHIYTPRENGLVMPWRGFGMVYLNPEYGRGSNSVGEWVKRAPDADSCIALVKAATGTKWFNRMLETADVHCAVEGRISFIHPETGEPQKNSTIENAFVGWAPDGEDRVAWLDRFVRTFKSVGRVYLESHCHFTPGGPL